MPEVLLTGVSMRAAAQSAVKAGYHTHTIDAFGDLDLPPPHTRPVPIDGEFRFDAQRAASDTAGVEADAVVYGSGFEDDSPAVDRLSQGRVLWGNPPDVLQKVRSPRGLLEGLAQQGFRVPRIFEPAGGAVPLASVAWLEKPFRSGGGHGIRRWRPGSTIAEGSYLEEFIAGSPGSIVFVARAGRAVPLGISRQLAGDAAFGATGFQYCGSILSHPADLFDRGVSVATTAHAVAMAVARDYGLVGLNNVDFIARHGVAYPVEVNPRWSASVELVERAHGFSMFGLHADACARGTLPDDRLPLCLRRAVGKAIVFARADVVVRRSHEWLWSRDVADVPRPGSLIRRGEPVCTVFAEAPAADQCYWGLVRRAARIDAEVATWV
ncbi:MAG TPA: ATP-grasp domain-containing protein [Vicinamibacterales bacterium]|jgi:predicted ATP-grasp superfamily ATP-dependent carboligase|nr:ATP-grasp domain-containing protein [Vicinamibacterales bacterium]